MRPIAISGFMATGKSTVGRLVASRMGVPFVDTDTEISREAGVTVPELWGREGEARFRLREAAVVRRLLDDDVLRVISLGGGSVTRKETRDMLTERAFLVTLTASERAVLARAGPVKSRPNLDVPDPLARIRELLLERADAYAETHRSIATDDLSAEAVADAVVCRPDDGDLLVPLGKRSYLVHIVDDRPDLLGARLAALAPSRILIVTDTNVHHACFARVAAALAPYGERTTLLTMAPGETNKTLHSVASVWDAALAAGVDRNALVVGLGGGVVGDIAGFAAATLLRGVRLLQVPTTLLAMVDSSVGGKTGFDHARGKNLIGAFHQPAAVVADLAHLGTLPARERTAGFAEIVKVGLVADAALFEELEREAGALVAGDRGVLQRVIRRSVAAKIRLVRDDERDDGRRSLLNLGHTVGHALEAHGGFGRYLHGEAVALGMVAELRATASMFGTPRSLVERTTALLSHLGLPTTVDRTEQEASSRFLSADKKMEGATLRLPVVKDLGEATVLRADLASFRSTLLG